MILLARSFSHRVAAEGRKSWNAISGLVGRQTPKDRQVVSFQVRDRGRDSTSKVVHARCTGFTRTCVSTHGCNRSDASRLLSKFPGTVGSRHLGQGSFGLNEHDNL